MHEINFVEFSSGVKLHLFYLYNYKNTITKYHKLKQNNTLLT